MTARLRLLLAPALFACAVARAGSDPYSFANVDQFRVVHLALDLTVDFTSGVLRGNVGIELRRLDPAASQVVLDTRDLVVTEVSQLATDIVGATSKGEPFWVSRPYTLGRPDKVLGSPLVIELPPSRAPTETIKVEYETTPGAAALQWLKPAQTAGGRQPFMYTQSEPINARSWIPLQDTPLVRMTYRAEIHTPDGVIAVMTAPNDPKSRRSGNFAFDMRQTVPSYLIALAVGDLKFKSLGPRTGVYAERPAVAAAAREFADVEAMLRAAEAIAGPYRWGRYDILVMPPSFPTGGMENPELSFITPTVIAGDKSLMSLVAHELAHSWAGNLTGNATWRDLWLNEGFAVYLESRIIRTLYGDARGDMDDALSLAALRRTLARLDPDEQILAANRPGRDPDAVFTGVPYGKGALFLGYLEAKFGRTGFDGFLRRYYDEHEFEGLTTEEFVAYLQDNLLAGHPGTVSRAEIDAWVAQAGIPADAVLPSAAAFDRVDAARAAWLAGAPAASLDTHAWAAEQWQHFLEGMPALPPTRLAELDAAFVFSRSHNAEVEHDWFMLAVRDGYRPAFPALETYLTTIGRRKLVKPLYEELMKSAAGAEFAKRVYSRARPGYHPLMTGAIDAIVR